MTTATYDRLTTLTQFTTQTCYLCGVPFAMEAGFELQRRKDGKTWYCPNGHGQVYTGKTPDQKRIDELAASLAASRRIAENERELRQTVERSRAAVQGVATKRAKQLARVANGVCPCCNRSFADLRRHMAGQHPGFKPGGAS